MNEENKAKNRGHELGTYLAKNFVVIMLVIYLSEQIINLIYQRCLIPLLTDVLKVQAITQTQESISGTMALMLRPAWSLISDRLPFFLVKPVNGYIASVAGSGYQAPDFIAQYGSLAIRLYYTTILVLIVLQLILSIAPYAIGCWWYIRCIARKMAELREQDARMKAEFDKRRNLLFSDITHDIKTPITSIVGYSKALSDGMVTDPERQNDYLHSIYNKSLRISELITMLFEFVKLDSDGFSLHRETLDMAELVRENVIMLLEDFDEKHIDLDIDVPEEMCLVFADRIQLSRVVTNLLTNAIRYIHTGHMVQVKMVVLGEGDQQRYRLCVADDGLPIEEDFAKTIFDPFSRSDAARQTTSGGSGLGLSIAHKVARMHEGDLRLDLAYGQGYEKAFVLEMPAWQADRNG